MFLPLYLGVLHAMEPDHVAVVTGVSLSGERRGAWKVGLALMLANSRCPYSTNCDGGFFIELVSLLNDDL